MKIMNMKSKKLSLNSLKVKSFVTGSDLNLNTIIGKGADGTVKFSGNPCSEIRTPQTDEDNRTGLHWCETQACGLTQIDCATNYTNVAVNTVCG